MGTLSAAYMHRNMCHHDDHLGALIKLYYVCKSKYKVRPLNTTRLYTGIASIFRHLYVQQGCFLHACSCSVYVNGTMLCSQNLLAVYRGAAPSGSAPQDNRLSGYLTDSLAKPSAPENPSFTL